MNGIGFVDSAKLSNSEIDPGDAGEVSNDGLRVEVMPARVNVTAETAAAGE